MVRSRRVSVQLSCACGEFHEFEAWDAEVYRAQKRTTNDEVVEHLPTLYDTCRITPRPDLMPMGMPRVTVGSYRVDLPHEIKARPPWSLVSVVAICSGCIQGVAWGGQTTLHAPAV